MIKLFPKNGTMNFKTKQRCTGSLLEFAVYKKYLIFARKRWPNGIIFGGMIEIILINDTVEFERIPF